MATVTSTMRAVMLRELGGPEVLSIEDVEVPRPAPDEVLIRVRACGVCRHDVVVRNGTQRRAHSLPLILGHEIAGDVIEVGPAVTLFKEGDRVACKQVASCRLCQTCLRGAETLCDNWRINEGGFAEYVTIPHESLVIIPDSVSYEDGSVVSCAMGVGWHAMRQAQLGPTDTVLITGAGGGLGSHSIQLARLFGATVIAQTSSKKEEFVRGLEPDHLIISDDLDFAGQVHEVTGGRGADVVIENIGHAAFEPSWKSLARLGRFLFVGATAPDTISFNPARIFMKGATLFGVTSTRKIDLEELMELAGMGKVKPIVSGRYALAEISKVHELMEKNQIPGRAVVIP